MFFLSIQGTKVMVSNLQPTVSYEDILELFGDIGAIKRAKVTTPGTAEIVYVSKPDAVKAVEVYHNRQLDGKPMKILCTTSDVASLESPRPKGSQMVPRNR